jgi:hypothetical protein
MVRANIGIDTRMAAVVTNQSDAIDTLCSIPL